MKKIKVTQIDSTYLSVYWYNWWSGKGKVVF